MIQIVDAKNEHLPQILQLQSQNFKERLNSEEIAQEGFVTIRHNLDLLSKMNKLNAHTIAISDDQVVGYALTLMPQHFPLFTDLQPMIQLLESFPPYMIMGQVCVAKDFRGKGLFRSMYEHMQEKFKGEFDLIITEVSVSNIRSLNAHFGIGFKLAKKREGWQIISLETNR